MPNASETNGLRDEQQSERRGELGQRRRRAQRPEDPRTRSSSPTTSRKSAVTISAGAVDRYALGLAEGRGATPGRSPRLQRPVAVAGEHRHRPGRQVDDPRAAVREDDPDRDPRDQRPRPEAEDREEDDLLPVHVVSLTAGTKAGPPMAAPPSRGRRSCLASELERRRRPAGTPVSALELPGSVVLEELRLVVAGRRLGRVLPALEARRAERLRALERPDRRRRSWPR